MHSSPEGGAHTFLKIAFRAAVMSGVVVTAAAARRHNLYWGATGQEKACTLAGDDLLASADQCATRAITVKARASDVWPWVAQLGQGRGGFYSYDLLENLVARADIHNAGAIVDEWQHPDVGGEISLAPEVPLRIAAVEPGRFLVLRGSVPMGRVSAPYDFTWAFVIRSRPDGGARLLVRERYLYTKPWAPLIVQPAQLVSSLMTPKMLRGIKSRAEAP